METKNIGWINYAKAICIIMIFLVHSCTFYGLSIPYLGTFVHPVYVNTFFIISGYLLFRKQLSSPIINEQTSEYMKNDGKKYIQNVVFRLMIPSLLFSVLEFFPSYILRGYKLSFVDFFVKTIGGGTYWFTAALAISELLVFVVLLFRQKNIGFYFAASIGAYVVGQFAIKHQVCLFQEYGSFPWEWKIGLLSTVFLVIGGLYWKFEKKVSAFFEHKIMLLGVLVLYVFLLLMFPSSFRVLISMEDINVLGIVISTVGAFILIELCKIIKNARLLNWIGKKTIAMYFMSGALPIVINLAVKNYLHLNGYCGLGIVFFGSFLIGLFITWLIDRYMPFLLDFRMIKKK